MVYSPRNAKKQISLSSTTSKSNLPSHQPFLSPSFSWPRSTLPPSMHRYPPLELYMHDILGGSNPTARLITGLLGNIYNVARSPSRGPPIGFNAPRNGVVIPNANGQVPHGERQKRHPAGRGPLQRRLPAAKENRLGRGRCPRRRCNSIGPETGSASGSAPLYHGHRRRADERA
jgi:hypothetical protein